MKKLLLLLTLSTLLQFCSERITESNIVKAPSISNKETFRGSIPSVEKPLKGVTVLQNASLSCGSYGNPFTSKDENLREYAERYNVAAYPYDSILENCPNNGKSCMDLSHFIVNYFVSNSIKYFQAFYSRDQEINFNQYSLPGISLEVTETSVGQDENSAQYYGNIFPYGSFMSTEAKMAVLTAIVENINSLKENHPNMKIRAMYCYKGNLLCIPAFSFIDMKVKYSKN